MVGGDANLGPARPRKSTSSGFTSPMRAGKPSPIPEFMLPSPSQRDSGAWPLEARARTRGSGKKPWPLPSMARPRHQPAAAETGFAPCVYRGEGGQAKWLRPGQRSLRSHPTAPAPANSDEEEDRASSSEPPRLPALAKCRPALFLRTAMTACATRTRSARPGAGSWRAQCLEGSIVNPRGKNPSASPANLALATSLPAGSDDDGLSPRRAGGGR